MHKRSVLISLLFCLSAIPAVAAEALRNKPLDARAALSQLEAGNSRAARGKARHPRSGAPRRAELAKTQAPFAVVVSCSDSRVPPELVFDQGLGDLFVVRVAGNVLDDAGLGSIEYAVEHLGSALVVVLGHERCGAVQAAVTGGKVSGHLSALVDAINPAVEATATVKGDRLDAAVRANVARVVEQIRSSEPILADAAKSHLAVVGMIYDLDTGRVERLP